MMVLQKHDSGICLSTPEQTSASLSTSTMSSATSSSGLNSITSVDIQLSASTDLFDQKTISDVDKERVLACQQEPLSADSDDSSTTPRSGSSGSATPTTERPEVDLKSTTSSAADSGRASCCSPVDRPVTVVAAPSSGSRSRTAEGTQRQSLGQKLLGVFHNKSPSDKVTKSVNSQGSRTQQDTVAAAASSMISPKDQKILSLMMRRQEEERMRQEQRDRVSSQSVPQRRSRPSSAIEPCASPLPSGATTPRTAYARPQLSTPHNGYNARWSIVSDSTTPSSDSRRTSMCSLASSTTDTRIQPLDTTRMKFAEKTDKRRQSVEQRLEQQRREMEEHQRQVKMKQEQDLQRANSMRLSREQQQALRARQANEKVQQKHEIVSRQRQQSVEDLSSRREEINARLASAESKARKIKDEEIRKNRTELQKRLEQSRQRQRQMEAELENWQQELVTFNQWQGDHAEKSSRQASAVKSATACKTRLEKEKKQQENMKKLMTGEEKKMAEMEALLESKEARTRELQREKEEMIQRSRSRAQAMKQARDEVRAHYSMNDLDQLARQVVLENRLLTRHPDSSAQTSLMSSMTSLT